MINLVKAELFKLRKEKSTWIILLVIILSNTISILTGVYSSAENAFFSMAKDIMVMLLSIAVYSGVSLFRDFQNRTIIHYVVGGLKRSYIIAALYIRYFMGCLILIFAYPFICTLIAGAIKGYENAFFFSIGQMLKVVIMGVPLYACFISFYFSIMMIVRQGVFSMGISIASSILIVVLTNKLYYGNPAREESIFRFAPSIQLQVITNGVLSIDYLVSVIFSLIVLLVAFLGASYSFRKAELK